MRALRTRVETPCVTRCIMLVLVEQRNCLAEIYTPIYCSTSSNTHPSISPVWCNIRLLLCGFICGFIRGLVAGLVPGLVRVQGHSMRPRSVVLDLHVVCTSSATPALFGFSSPHLFSVLVFASGAVISSSLASLSDACPGIVLSRHEVCWKGEGGVLASNCQTWPWEQAAMVQGLLYVPV
jgi:thiamine transporter ThiT